MKNISKLLIIIISIFIIFGCSNETYGASNNYQTITADDAYYMINSNPDIIVLDVRTKEEYDEEHLVNAINIPYDEIKTRFKEDITDNIESVIIIYCKSGKRATTASETLINMGYLNVYTFGSIDEWNYDTTSE